MSETDKINESIHCQQKQNKPPGELNILLLFNHLWKATEILVGSADAGGFTTYIFPLFVFKWISDDFKQNALSCSKLGGLTKHPRLRVPKGCHWEDVRANSEEIGYALQKALRCIEQANPNTLAGIFGDADWTNNGRFHDPILKEVMEHMSLLNLGNSNCEADALGQAYEHLIKKFTGLTIKKIGAFYTPRATVASTLSI